MQFERRTEASAQARLLRPDYPSKLPFMTPWRVLLHALNEEHLKRLLKEFIKEYYHLARPHQGLNGDTPVLRANPNLRPM